MPPPKLNFHPYYGWYTIRKGIKMTNEEKEDRLRGYPYYADSALEFMQIRSGKEVDQEGIDAIISAMALAMSEGQLALVRAMLLFAEKQLEKQIAGLLSGLKPAKLKQWIEEHK